MSRITKYKLVLLLCACLSATALHAGTQWVGISAQSPAQSHITTNTSNSTAAEISIDIPGFYFTETVFEGKSYKLAQLPGGHPILAQGCPDLHKLSFTLQLSTAGDTKVSVTGSKYIEYTNIDILPSAGDEIRNGSVEKRSKGLAYSTNAFFPGDLYSAQDPFAVRNTRAQAFQVYPFQYNPVTRVLRFYYQLTLTVDNVQPVDENSVSGNKIQSVEGIGINCINRPVSRLKSGQLPADRGCMLIICPDNFRNAIEPLADWRIQTGIPTEVISSGQFANADAIYAFVKGYYQNHSNFAYLLLVGDAAQVPTFVLPYGASDNYYSYLAGNDHYPDILVGRFSAETVKDVEVQVNRTLEYEKNPALDSKWLTTATGLASTLGPGDDGEYDFQHVNNMLNELKTTTYSDLNEFFDGSQGGADADGNPSTSDVINKINKGTGVIFYTGHGSPNSWATGSVTRSAVDGLSNTGHYPLIWSAACENGNFVGQKCFAESWLRASNSAGQPTGALAALMASGSQTSYPPMQAQDVIADLMTNPTEDISTMGAISVKGMMSMNDVYGSAGYATTDTWILFGDPSLRVRTASPKQFNIEQKGTIGKGRLIYSFTCNASSGYACISSQGTILGTTAITEGSNTIYLDHPASGQELTLTITALNYLPSVTSIQVTNMPGAAEAITPVNHSKLQPIDVGFAWENNEGANADYYLFYLGTDNPPSNLINGQMLTLSQVKTQFNFEYNTTYYWKVVSANATGQAESKVMDFTTVYKPDEDFEANLKTRLVWNDSGSQSWQNDASQHFEGSHSIRSGQIADNQFSALAYQCEVSACDFVSFWSKTSSEVNDKLQFLVDGVTIGEWGGITDWSYHSFKVDAGMHKLEWRYTKNGNTTAGEDAVWLDNIHLPVHAGAAAEVASNSSVCANAVFQSVAKASNYFNLTWKSDGDGSFNDPNLENITYTPGLNDLQAKRTTLHLQLNGYQGCPEIEKTINLKVQSLPEINLPSDTIVSNGSSIVLDAGSDNNLSYSWQPDGSTSASISIDSTSSVGGTKTAIVTVTNSGGCSATKEVKVHFNNPAIDDAYSIYPNPSNGNFTLKPQKGTAVIDHMQLVNNQGQVVWQSGGNLNIIGSQQMSIPGLNSGAYFLVAENSNGRTVNTVVIR